MRVVLLPVKNPDRAKQRLGSVFSQTERRRLMWAMLEDVSAALRGAGRPDRVVVVSSCQQIRDWARQMDWEVMEERRQLSESHSVDRCSAKMSRQGVTSSLRLPADIPLLRSQDVDALFDHALPQPSAILVPSRDGTGTNALLRTPPDAFPSRFGENSLALHQAEASRRGIQYRVLRNPRIGLDLDQPEDILHFLSEGEETRTAQLLDQLDSLRRLEHATGLP